MGFGQHGGVVVGITSGNNTIVNTLQCDDRLTLRVFLTQLVVDNTISLVGDQAVTQQRRETQLAHQRLRELVKGVRENDHLETLAKPVNKLDGAVQRLQRRDHFLDIRQFKAMLVQNGQALLHKHIVIRDVAGGCLEFLDAGLLGKGNPDFGDQHPFQVKASDFHTTLLIFKVETGAQSTGKRVAAQSQGRSKTLRISRKTHKNITK